MKVVTLVVAIFGLIAVLMALVTGAAGGGGRFHRADEPLKFWAIIAAGLILCAGLFWTAR